ncbi:MAG: WS/DGAT domain-containing protein [Mycobacterium sp.]
MTVEQMAPRDAQMYWMSAQIPNDQFLLFCFDSPTADVATVRRTVSERAARIADLRVRAVEVPGHLDYPYWGPRDESDVPVTVHALAEPSWDHCRSAIAALLTSTVDIRECPWRLHLFFDVQGAPHAWGPALIAVLQVSHALADGRRGSAAARALFGDDAPTGGTLPEVPMLTAIRGLVDFPTKFGRLLGASRSGYLAYRRQQELVAAGELEPEPQGFPLISLNAKPDERREIRMIVRPRDELRAPDVSVTVAVLAAIGMALPQYLRDHGQWVPDRLGVELTVAEPGESVARNHFRNVGVDLCWTEQNLRTRTQRITEVIDSRRRRASHPVLIAQRAGGAALPAPMMWAGVNAFNADIMPPTVAGNTVVSSVVRGAADLTLAGGQVVFTAGFPALSPVMGLTHGIHGIGDAVTVSVHTSSAVMPDVDHYESLLADALDTVSRGLR